MSDPVDRTEVNASALRDRVLNAALDEFRIRGIDDFSMRRVAERAGVPFEYVEGHWHSWRGLLLEAQLTRARDQIPTPDTGSLSGDLIELAGSLTRWSQTAQDRRSFQRNLPNNHDVDFLDVRKDFWNARFTDISEIFTRADARGELRENIDPVDAARLFCAAFFYDVTFADTPVRGPYGELVLDVLLHGFGSSSPRRGSAS